MKFKVIAKEKAHIPVRRACTLLDVSERGYYAWHIRKPSLRQRTDMVLLAHIRAQFSTSHETYGSPPATTSGTKLTDPSSASGQSGLTASIQTTSNYICVH
jgi:hypothetical protein